jgi:AcrR family transcriptional regulator
MSDGARARPYDPTVLDESRTAKFEARRNEIIDLAATLFARNSYAATGVAEISEAANLGKGGLYYYIGSKETLLVEIHERVMQPLLETTRAIAEADTTPLVRLRLVSESLLTVVTEHRDHVWVFLHEHRALTGALLERFRARRREYEDVVAGFFADGEAQATFRLDDLRLTTLGFLGLHNSAYQWIRPDGRLTPQRISQVYCRAFFGGIGVEDRTLAGSEQAVAVLRPLLAPLTAAG